MDKIAFDPETSAAEMSQQALAIFEDKAKQGNAGELAMAKQSVVAAGKTRQALATNDAEDIAAAIVANTTALDWAQDDGLKQMHQAAIDYFKNNMAKAASAEPGLNETLLSLAEETEALKAKFAALKERNSHEIEKALDDITSAFDIVTHHILDIIEDVEQ